MSSAARLADRIAFEKATVAGNGRGGTAKGWDTQFTVSARKQLLRGSEPVQAARLEGKQPIVLTVRASNETRQVTTEWRARDARTGALFNIVSVEPGEDRAFIAFLCNGGVAT